MKNRFIPVFVWLLSALFILVECSPIIFTDETNQESIPREELFSTKGGFSDVFYYYFNEKIFLDERGDLMCVRFKDNDAREKFIDGLYSTPIRVWNPDFDGANFSENSMNILLLQSETGEFSEQIYEDINSMDDVEYVSHAYGRLKSVSMVTDEFSVYLRNLSDYSTLEDLAATYGCTVVHREWFDENTFFVRRSKNSEYSTITLADMFYETGQFEFTSPDFIAFNALFSNDARFSDQWGLKNTVQYAGRDIGIEDAWNITEGSSDIKIAVLDNGVDSNHPDLSANLLQGFDFVQNIAGGNPVYDSEGHGTAVAGIIGAKKDNIIGIAGVAPECKIVPLRVSSQIYIQNSAAVAAFNWCVQNEVDVINCSWGGGNPCSLLTTAIYSAIESGRDGKGCVVVFASGNESASSVAYPSYLEGVMSIGACGPDGGRVFTSNYGMSLDAVAPGVDILSTERDDSYDYFTGTSFSAPFVSGIAALLLSKYPDLTQSQVRRSIELGCTQYSGYTYSLDNSYPTGSWNNQMGYGIANAFNSLLEASLAHQTNVTDSISGFDFTVTNHSSYDVWALFVGLTGNISNSSETLIFQDPGDVASGRYVGYPLYRGEDLDDTPGTPISNIQLEFFAMTPYYSGSLRIGVAIDNPSPASYTSFTFGDGDTVFLNLLNSTVPDASRRHVYIDIQNPLPSF